MKTVNGFWLLTTVTKNAILDAVGVLDLPLDSGKKVFALQNLKNSLLPTPSPPHYYHSLCYHLLNLSIYYRLTTNRAVISRLDKKFDQNVVMYKFLDIYTVMRLVKMLPLQLPSRLNPLGTGGRHYNEHLS